MRGEPRNGSKISLDPAEHMVELRDAISVLTQNLKEVIRARGRVALEIGVVKESLGLPIHDPEREAVLLDDMTSCDNNPFSAEQMREMLAPIIRNSRIIQQTVHEPGIQSL